MDTNGVITISSSDWSQHAVLEKTDSIPEIILYWKHSTVSEPPFTVTKNTICPASLNTFTCFRVKPGP